MTTTKCDKCGAEIKGDDLNHKNPKVSIDVGNHDFTASGRNDWTVTKDLCFNCRFSLMIVIKEFLGIKSKEGGRS